MRQPERSHAKKRFMAPEFAGRVTDTDSNASTCGGVWKEITPSINNFFRTQPFRVLQYLILLATGVPFGVGPQKDA
jgi:hypothetical protein